MSKDIVNGKRVLLSEHNTALTLRAIEDFKSKHCKLNMTDLVNTALDLFFEKHLTQYEKQIEKSFFDRKKYLKELLKSDSTEKLDESLKTLVRKINPRKKRKAKHETN